MLDGKVPIKDIINKVIKFMIKKGCKLNNITAAIGPSFLKKTMKLKKISKKSLLKKIKKI